MTCSQPGCGGTIQDGYCDTCGLAASAPSAPSGPSAWSGSALPASGPTSGVSGSRGGGRGSSRSARGRLGAGLVEIPLVPYRDPASAILVNPQIPENKRYCSGCNQPVGRGGDGRPGLTEGFCRNCGTRIELVDVTALPPGGGSFSGCRSDLTRAQPGPGSNVQRPVHVGVVRPAAGADHGVLPWALAFAPAGLRGRSARRAHLMANAIRPRTLT